MSDRPTVSFVIVSWNVRDLLRHCLRSIVTHTQIAHEVIVVDNASRDGSPKMVAAEFPQVKLIRHQVNLGFARANNRGLQEVRGDHIFFLNCDTELLEDSAAVLVAALRDQAVGLIGPELLNSDRTHQQSVRRFPTLADQVMVLLKLRPFFSWTPVMKRYFADPGAGQARPVMVDQIMGAAMMARAEVVHQLGGFDDGYPNWFEEVDLCQRARRAGYQIEYCPATRVIHHGGTSFRQVLSLKKHQWMLAGLRRYSRKFWPAWQAMVIAGLSYVSYGLTIVQSTFKPR